MSVIINKYKLDRSDRRKQLIYLTKCLQQWRSSKYWLDNGQAFTMEKIQAKKRKKDSINSAQFINQNVWLAIVENFPPKTFPDRKPWLDTTGYM